MNTMERLACLVDECALAMADAACNDLSFDLSSRLPLNAPEGMREAIEEGISEMKNSLIEENKVKILRKIVYSAAESIQK